MDNKGITLIELGVTVAIMLLIMSITIVVGTGKIEAAKFESFKQGIDIVQESISMRYEKDNILAVKAGDVSNALDGDKKISFISELSKKGDVIQDLRVVDVGMLYNLRNGKGKGTIADKDIYVVSTKSHNVYYLDGYKYKGNIYFGKVD